MAAEKAHYHKSSVYYFKKKFKDFKRRWEDSIDYYEDMLLQEVDRRGRRGVKKPVYYKGEVVGDIMEYSDTLLMFQLKSMRPKKYGDQKKKKKKKTEKQVKENKVQPIINLHLDATDNSH